MKIGIFDSGLGGLLITHSIVAAMPDYDVIYLGDAARVPYGNRSHELVYEFTREAVEYLFAQDCGLIIVACNTASAEALRRIQQEYLPKHYPDRRVLGVLIPAAEEAVAATQNQRIGVLATQGTVASGAFENEIRKLMPEAVVYQQAAPLLVPLIENDGLKWAAPILDSYLNPLLAHDIDTLILGCTHYPLIKAMIRAKVGKQIAVISQDELIPAKLRDYLDRHPEIDRSLSRTGARQFDVTDITEGSRQLAAKLYSENITLKKVSL